MGVEAVTIAAAMLARVTAVVVVVQCVVAKWWSPFS
jgi:hypothetical protein